MTEPRAPGVIEIRVGSIAQIFNSLDPSPFHDRDLDQAAEQFMMDWAREMPRDAPIVIKVCLPPAVVEGPEASGVPEAIGNYFAQRAEATKRQLREYFRLGRRYLAMGMAILIACLTASAAIGAVIPEGTISQILSEGLIIVGWVANWKPLEIFLYDWQPIRRRLRLFQRLAAAKIQLAPA
ncbi:MAG TPA: hypothetical protein VG735_01520 [Caulobacterales bacterium]|nr:hypothetical protein [Caulobacterales bacterium]